MAGARRGQRPCHQDSMLDCMTLHFLGSGSKFDKYILYFEIRLSPKGEEINPMSKHSMYFSKLIIYFRFSQASMLLVMPYITL